MAEAATRKCKESWSCETLGDLGGGSRHHTLHGVFGGVKYRKVRSFSSGLHCITTRCTGRTGDRCGFASKLVASASKLDAVIPSRKSRVTETG
jgi:hypothetical protein